MDLTRSSVLISHSFLRQLKQRGEMKHLRGHPRITDKKDKGYANLILSHSALHPALFCPPALICRTSTCGLHLLLMNTQELLVPLDLGPGSGQDEELRAPLWAHGLAELTSS